MSVMHAIPDDQPDPGLTGSFRAGFVLPAVPVPISSLIGRDDEVERILALVSRPDVRLATLTGPGGIGKTRLALEVARRAGTNAGFAELAATADPALIPAAVARALGLEPALDQPAERFLTTAIRDHSLLLVLDNFEHLLAGTALIAHLLGACPGLTILVTSRVRLGLSGEHVRQVEALDTPATGDETNASALARNDAVRLFVARASAAHAAFRLTDANAPAVARICQRLDGLPLAIELAAARSNLLSPESLAARLERRLSLLTGGPAELPPRLQTMRGALTWSVDLLDPVTRQAWRRLGCFEGGFTAEAAEAVCQPLLGPVTSMLDQLESLIRQGLLRSASNRLGEPRFAMLETAREYACDLAVEAGVNGAARQAHAGYVRTFAREVEPGLMGNDGETWFHRVEADIANVRAALRWHAAHDDLEAALEIAGNLAWFWTEPSYIAEGRSWFASLLASASEGVSPAIRAKAHGAAGDLADWHAETAVARAHNLQALALWREAGDRQRVGVTLRSLGSAAIDVFAADEAERLLAEAYDLALDVGDHWGAAAAANLRGTAAVFRDDLETAIQWHERGLRGWQALGDDAHVPTALACLGWAWLRSGDLRRAMECFDAVLDMAAEPSAANDATFAMLGVALVAGRLDRRDAAVRLTAASLNRRRQVGLPLRPPLQAVVDAEVAALRAAIGQARFALVWSEGLAMMNAEAVALARDIPSHLPPGTDSLSPREREVLRVLVEGASDHEIAARLYISRRTASKHVAAILDKLGAPNRTSAATIAHRRGLV